MADSLLGQAWDILKGKGSRPSGREAVAAESSLKRQAEKHRVPCLSVRTEGLPYGVGEYLATAADWWGKKVSGFVENIWPERADPNEQVSFELKGGAWVEAPPPVVPRPRIKKELGAPPGGFNVMLPGWEDGIIINGERYFDERTKKEQRTEFVTRLKQSPTPPGMDDLGRILTSIDDVQDIMATTSVLLMVAEKTAGRAIPGAGWVATGADALNLLYQAVGLDPKGRLPVSTKGSSAPLSRTLARWRQSPAGKEHKRKLAAKAAATMGGQKARLEELRRSGSLRIGVGDVLQGLQATTTLFGTGIQLGAYVGYVQDAFWGLVRGANFELPGWAFDPVGVRKSEESACFRSPRLSEISGEAYTVLAYNSLAALSAAARLGPWVDSFTNEQLTAYLLGVRQAEVVLRPWLESGIWVDFVGPMVWTGTPPTGYAGALGLSEDCQRDHFEQASMLTAEALTRALRQVKDPELSNFLSSVATSYTWGIWGSLEPDGILAGVDLSEPWADAVKMAEANLWPELDLV